MKCTDSYDIFDFFFLFHFQAGESSGLFKKTISKLSTEYRIQFIWPQTRKDQTKRPEDAVDFSNKKSKSMGALRAAHTNVVPAVHKKRTTIEKEGAT